MDINTYQLNRKCWNCKQVNDALTIPRGKVADKFIQRTKLLCKNCGCRLVDDFGLGLSVRHLRELGDLSNLSKEQVCALIDEKYGNVTGFKQIVAYLKCCINDGYDYKGVEE